MPYYLINVKLITDKLLVPIIGILGIEKGMMASKGAYFKMDIGGLRTTEVRLILGKHVRMMTICYIFSIFKVMKTVLIFLCYLYSALISILSA
jgi:hypothetical protein